MNGSAGVVVAMCTGHRCAALTRPLGDGGLPGAVARSPGAVLISAPCLQQCAHGAVGAIAIRDGRAGSSGRSVWLGGLDGEGRLQDLGHWVEHWRPDAKEANTLPETLHDALIGFGPPITLTASGS
jgi:hypothetical protein